MQYDALAIIEANIDTFQNRFEVLAKEVDTKLARMEELKVIINRYKQDREALLMGRKAQGNRNG